MIKDYRQTAYNRSSGTRAQLKWKMPGEIKAGLSRNEKELMQNLKILIGQWKWKEKRKRKILKKSDRCLRNPWARNEIHADTLVESL